MEAKNVREAFRGHYIIHSSQTCMGLWSWWELYLEGTEQWTVRISVTILVEQTGCTIHKENIVFKVIITEW